MHRELIRSILSELEKKLLDKRRELEYALTCLISGGHLLIEDVPGVGKTTLAKSLAQSFDVGFNRIQFTSDLLPSDLIGVSVYRRATEAFEFQPGPLFTNVLLADEINRANPKTQSALLEAMHESQVSHDSKTLELPAPFFVVATQNSRDHHGTFPLPESQLDRFLMRIHLGYPSREFEMRVFQGDYQTQEGRAGHDVSHLTALQDAVSQIHVDARILDFIYDIVNQTRAHTQCRVGVSPRGGQALYGAARGLALIRGREFVVPDDVRELAPLVCAHRILVQHSGGHGHFDVAAQVIHDVLDNVTAPD